VPFFDFDSRAISLREPGDDWSKDVVDNHNENRERTIEDLRQEFGSQNLERKTSDLTALGPAPWSIVAHHNAFFRQIRNTFVAGNYYPALTAACALGERILNHLIIDLRDHFRSSPRYREVYRKESFDDWARCTEILTEWKVLEPGVKSDFEQLMKLRHRSIHFNQKTYETLRDDSLEACRKAHYAYHRIDHN
jgi:hypothetical protein